MARTGITQTILGSATSREGWRAPRRVWLFVGAVAAAAIGMCLLASAETQRVGPPHELSWPLLAIAIFASSFVRVEFNFRNQTHTVDFLAVPMVAGAAMTPPGSVLVAGALAVFAAHALARRPPVRSVFNVANQMLGFAAAVTAWQLVIGLASPASLRAWLAAPVALLAYDVVTASTVAVVIGLSAGKPGAQYFKQVGLQTAIFLPLSAAFAVAAIEAYWSQTWSLLALGVPLIAVAFILRSSRRLRGRFDDLESLYDFTGKLADLSERSEVLAVALRESRQIVHCSHIELYVPRSKGAYRYRLDEHGAIIREAASLSGLESAVVESKEPRLIRVGADDAYLETQGFSDAMVVPMVDDEHPAVIIAADHDGNETSTFEPDDLKLLQALAAHLSTALTSCGRLDRLRSEVAARQHEAYHDSLTGLANRSLFSQVVTDALTHRRGSRLVAVMLMDLDGFKEINDTLGHHAGDAILKEVASRVGGVVGPRRVAARLGGDEFAFVLGSASRMDEVTALAQEVLTAVGAPISVDGMILTIRASIGIATAPSHGADASTLLKCADIAMYASKSAGKGITVYDSKIDNNSTRRLVLASELQRAVETDGFELYFQPIADLADGSITGFEALLRWPHYDLGSVPPDEFIPVAEQTGLIEPITWWVVKRALEELRYWRNSGYDVDMAINVSARSLLDNNLVDRLRLMMTGAGVSPAHVTLEITESSMMLDLGDSEQILRELSNLGLRLAIDDFGTGYSSLARLKMLPVDVVKVDRSFVKNMVNDADDLAIVRSTIELAKVMGHQVVAEGVEDLETWEELRDLGCTLAQGYYFSFPMNSANCRKWVRAKQSPTLAPVTRLKPHIA